MQPIMSDEGRLAFTSKRTFTDEQSKKRAEAAKSWRERRKLDPQWKLLERERVSQYAKTKSDRDAEEQKEYNRKKAFAMRRLREQRRAQSKTTIEMEYLNCMAVWQMDQQPKQDSQDRYKEDGSDQETGQEGQETDKEGYGGSDQERYNYDNIVETKHQKYPVQTAWKQNISKEQRCRGEGYMSKSGKHVSERKLGPPCRSKFCDRVQNRQCSSLSEDQRQHIFDQFWSLDAWEKRKLLVTSLVAKVDKKQKRVAGPSRRQASFNYYLWNANGKTLQVCKSFFASTFGIGQRTIMGWIKPKKCDPKRDIADSRMPVLRLDVASLYRQPYLCLYCTQYFVNFDQFNRHKRRHLKILRKFWWHNNWGQPTTKTNYEITGTQEDYAGNDLVTALFMSEWETEQSGEIVNRKHFRLFECPICRKCYNKKCNLTTHLKYHKNERRYSCAFCDRTFVQRSEVTIHERTHTGERPYHCRFCAKSFSAKSYVALHERTHSKDKPYQCQYCQKCFTQRHSWVSHERLHRNERPYQCDQCDSAFVSNGALKNHAKKHLAEKPFKCSLCDKQFTVKNKLNRHERLHSGEKPHACDKCPKSFSEKSNLMRHYQSVHTQQKPFQCSHCEKSFSEKANLLRHERQHTGERPFKCSQCDEAFVSSDRLLTHEMKHKGGLPHKCSHCSKAFAWNSDLVQHERIHTGVKPHMCKHCQKAFTQASNRNRHEKFCTKQDQE